MTVNYDPAVCVQWPKTTIDYCYMRNAVRNDTKLHLQQITMDSQGFVMTLNCTVLAPRKSTSRVTQNYTPCSSRPPQTLATISRPRRHSLHMPVMLCKQRLFGLCRGNADLYRFCPISTITPFQALLVQAFVCHVVDELISLRRPTMRLRTTFAGRCLLRDCRHLRGLE